MAVGFGVPQLIQSEAGGFISMILLLAIIFFSGWLKGTGLREIGLNRPESWPRSLLLGLLYALVIFLLFRIALEPILENLTGVERDLSRFDYLKGNLGALANTLVMLWITAAFFEEVMFRGFLITNVEQILGNRKGSWIVGLIVSSLIFALVHGYQGVSGVVLTGVAALFLGLIFLFHGRNLWIPIFTHGLTDSSAAFLFYFDTYDQVTGVIFS
jgi:membrane protease YdiL (CAAX protease family)